MVGQRITLPIRFSKPLKEVLYLQVMDPSNYETVTVSKLDGDPLGEKAKIIRVDGEILLLPGPL